MKDPHNEAMRICMKWLNIVGLGLDIDLPAADYVPAFDNAEMATDYDADMETLHALECDPYEAHYDAFVKWDLG